MRITHNALQFLHLGRCRSQKIKFDIEFLQNNIKILQISSPILSIKYCKTTWYLIYPPRIINHFTLASKSKTEQNFSSMPFCDLTIFSSPSIIVSQGEVEKSRRMIENRRRKACTFFLSFSFQNGYIW